MKPNAGGSTSTDVLIPSCDCCYNAADEDGHPRPAPPKKKKTHRKTMRSVKMLIEPPTTTAAAAASSAIQSAEHI